MTESYIEWPGTFLEKGDTVILIGGKQGGKIEAQKSDVLIENKKLRLSSEARVKLVEPPTADEPTAGEVHIKTHLNPKCPKGGREGGQTYAILGVIFCCAGDKSKPVDNWWPQTPSWPCGA
jgi:hypothetical protein